MESKSDTAQSYKTEYAFAERKKESDRIRTKYPDRIPVIVEHGGNVHDDMPVLNKRKYLTPADLTLGQFVFVIRKRLQLPAEKAIFLFTERNTLPPTADLMSDLYYKDKNIDGFLYLKFSGENTFGAV